MRLLGPDRRCLRELRALVAAAAGGVAVPVLAGGGAVPARGGLRAPGVPAWGLLSVAATSATAPAGPGGRGGDSGDGAEQERMAALVTLAQQGDAEAFGQIYDSYVDGVYRYLHYRVGSQQLAEDLTSETFLRALRRIDSFTWQGKDIGAWFVTIARNLVTDHFKSSRFRLELSTGDILDADRADDGIEDQVVERLQNAELLSAVRELKPEQQECIVLRFLQGLTVAETAEVMCRSEGAVKQLQLRAVRALARLLPQATS